MVGRFYERNCRKTDIITRMKVKILPRVGKVNDGVSRYMASLVTALESLGVEIVETGSYDVLHLVAAHRYDREWRAAKARGARLIVTVHDLIPEHFGLVGPQYSDVAMRREVLEAADAIIAVSQFTKDDVVSTYGISPKRIHVVHNGAERALYSPSQSSLRKQVEQPFILWVGRRAGYKNFLWFVWSVAPLLWKHDWKVVCTGGQAFGRKEKLLIGLLGLARRFENVRVDDASLHQLYQDALCLVMPSKSEGFGLPVVEAMANGCPVVIPRAHVFPEIAGGAALYFEPGDGRMMRRFICQCANAQVRGILAERGRKQARQYSWKTCAEKVKAVYECDLFALL